MKKFTIGKSLTLMALLLFTSKQVSISQTMVWSDEFDYTGLPDDTKWDYDVMTPGTVNNELQNYTYKRLENSRVENGSLVIEARNDNYLGYQYSSARLVTRGKGDWLYGRVEVKAMLPAGTGSWPAIWMLPTDWVYGGWPNSGEIDIMEHVGKDPGVIHASTHCKNYYFVTNNQKTATINVPDFATAYHVYAMEWSPSKIDVYVDNTLYFTSTNENTTWASWPFNERFHLILNIAVGGDWGGRVDNRSLPWQMKIDYVRVYSYTAPADNQAPPTPTSLVAAPSSSSATLTWEPCLDNYAIKQYEIYNGTQLVGTTIYPNYTITGLNPLTSYTFKVRAVDFSNNTSGYVSVTTTTSQVVVTNIPALIEAENYDVMYGIQTETTTDAGGGLNVGWIDAGDYMEYVVGVATAGYFAIDYRAASLNGGGQIQVKDVNGNVLSTTDIPVTGGWQAWTTISSTAFNLPQGNNRLRIYASAGGFNLNWLQFKSSVYDVTAPTSPTNLSLLTSRTSVTLSWSASTDNTGVTGYKTYRNGVYVATTTNLSYKFTGLTSKTSYTFGVSAIDGAGNESAISSIGGTTKSALVSTNIDQSIPSNKMTLYPNPAASELRIVINDNIALIEISDISGKQVALIKSVSSNMAYISLSSYKQGIYFVKVQSLNGEVMHSSFIKK